jgi:hypothetical protein
MGILEDLTGGAIAPTGDQPKKKKKRSFISSSVFTGKKNISKSSVPVIDGATTKENQQLAAETIDDIINELSVQYGVDPNLINGIVKTESNFNPSAVSKAGAQGLMQLMPNTAKEMGVTKPFDVRQNLDGGIRYFKQMLDLHNGDYKVALEAYNAGPTKVNDVYVKKTDTFARETLEYPGKVLRNTQLYTEAKKVDVIPKFEKRAEKFGLETKVEATHAIPNEGEKTELDFFSGRTLKKAVIAPAQGLGDIAKWLAATAENRDHENWLAHGSDFVQMTDIEFKQRVVDRARKEGKTVEEMRMIVSKENAASMAKTMRRFAEVMPDEIKGSSGAWEDGLTGVLRFLPTIALTAANPASGFQASSAQIAGPKYDEYIAAGLPEQMAWELAASQGFAQGVVELGGNLVQIGLLKALFRSKTGQTGLIKIPAKLESYIAATLFSPVLEGGEEILQFDIEKTIDLYAQMPDADLDLLHEYAFKMRRSPEYKEGRAQSFKAGVAGGAFLGGGSAQMKVLFDVRSWLNKHGDARIVEKLEEADTKKQEEKEAKAADEHERTKLDEIEKKPKEKPATTETDIKDEATAEPTKEEQEEIKTTDYQLPDSKLPEPEKPKTSKEAFNNLFNRYFAEEKTAPKEKAIVNDRESLLKSGEEIPAADTEIPWTKLTQPAVLHPGGITTGPVLQNVISPSKGLVRGETRTEVGESWSKARNQARKEGHDMTDSQEGFLHKDRFIHKNAKIFKLEEKVEAKEEKATKKKGLKPGEADVATLELAAKAKIAEEKRKALGARSTPEVKKAIRAALELKKGQRVTSSKLLNKAINHPDVKYILLNKEGKQDVRQAALEAVTAWHLDPKHADDVMGKGLAHTIMKRAAQNAAKETRKSRAAIDAELRETGGKLKDELSLREELIADTGRAVADIVIEEEGLEAEAKGKVVREMSADKRANAIEKLQNKIDALIKDKSMNALVKARKIKAIRAGIKKLALTKLTTKSKESLIKKRERQQAREVARRLKEKKVREKLIKAKQVKGKETKPLTEKEKKAQEVARSQVQIIKPKPQVTEQAIEINDYPRRISAEVDLEDLQKNNPKAEYRIQKKGDRFKIVEIVKIKQPKTKAKEPKIPAFKHPHAVQQRAEFISDEEFEKRGKEFQQFKTKKAMADAINKEVKVAKREIKIAQPMNEQDLKEAGLTPIDIDTALDVEPNSGLEQFHFYSGKKIEDATKQRKPKMIGKTRRQKEGAKKAKAMKELNRLFAKDYVLPPSTTTHLVTETDNIVDELVEDVKPKTITKEQEIERLVADQLADQASDITDGEYILKTPEGEQDAILDILKNEKGRGFIVEDLARGLSGLTVKGYHVFKTALNLLRR